MAITTASLPSLQRWLVEAPHVGDGGITFARELAEAVRTSGTTLWRSSLCLLTMHPEVFWRNLQWNEQEGVKILERQHETLQTPYFTDSPIAFLRSGAPPIRVRLGDGELPFPICQDLRQQGGTDYYAQGLRFSNSEISYVSWATRAPAGFSDDEIALFDGILPYLSHRVELESAYHGTRALLEVYLGQNAARRVVDGNFRRGGGERIEAAIWFCDLRGFTAISDRLSAEEVVPLLDGYFDCVAGPIVEHGGEVLKFIGDAILAIFPTADDPRGACRRALQAATEALDALAALNRTSAEKLSIGIALHLGSVMYGNVGARRRLDFTVISSSVNEASRLEALCKPLGTPLTLSERFAHEVTGEEVADLGEHALKGVKTPLRVFTLARYRP
jgi:adenylate cyclase